MHLLGLLCLCLLVNHYLLLVKVSVLVRTWKTVVSKPLVRDLSLVGVKLNLVAGSSCFIQAPLLRRLLFSLRATLLLRGILASVIFSAAAFHLERHSNKCPWEACVLKIDVQTKSLLLDLDKLFDWLVRRCIIIPHWKHNVWALLGRSFWRELGECFI